MQKLTFLLFLLCFSVMSQSVKYRINTIHMGVIEATKIKHSDDGKRVYVEQLDGEILNLDIEKVKSIRSNEIGYVEQPNAEFLNFKLDYDKKLVWQKIYDTDKSIEEIEKYFNDISFTSSLELVNNKISGRSNKITLRNQKGLYAPVTQPFEVFILIELKEGKYRVTITDLQFEPYDLMGMTYSVNWEEVAVRDNHYEIRQKSSVRKFLTNLDKDFDSYFTIEEKSSDDW